MHAVFITIPKMRPKDAGPMRPIDECVEKIEPGNGVIDPNGPMFRSVLPEGCYRTESIDIDMGMVCRVEDIGEYVGDIFKPTACRIYFRIPNMPPVDVEMTRQEFVQLMSNTTQSFVRGMQSAQQNQIVSPQSMPMPQRN